MKDAMKHEGCEDDIVAICPTSGVKLAVYATDYDDPSCADFGPSPKPGYFTQRIDVIGLTRGGYPVYMIGDMEGIFDVVTRGDLNCMGIVDADDWTRLTADDVAGLFGKLRTKWLEKEKPQKRSKK